MAMMSWPPVCCKMNERWEEEEQKEKGGREGEMARGKKKDMGKPGKTRMKLSKTTGWWADCAVELKFFADWHLHLFQYSAKHETKSYPFLPKYSPKHFVGVKGGKGKPKIERVLGGRDYREKKEHWYIPRNPFQPLTFTACPVWSLSPTGQSSKVQDQDCLQSGRVCQISKPKTRFFGFFFLFVCLLSYT